MDKIDEKEIDRLRKLGAVEELKDGVEGVRLTAQFRGAPTSQDRASWNSSLKDWERALGEGLQQFGAHTVDGSPGT